MYNEDFFDEIYSEEEPSQRNEKQILESLLQRKGSDGRTRLVSSNMFEDSDY